MVDAPTAIEAVGDELEHLRVVSSKTRGSSMRTTGELSRCRRKRRGTFLG